MIKTLIYVADGKPVAVLMRGDHEANEGKIRRALGAETLELADEKTIQKVTGAPVGFAGPVGIGCPIIADHDVPLIAECGLRRERRRCPLHRRQRGPGLPPRRHARSARCRRAAILAPTATARLELVHGIEVGHVFKLGTKYSEALDARFLDEKEKRHAIIMGCYGIGINRIIASTAETSHDDNGLIWPLSIAPYSVLVIPLNVDDAEVQSVANRYYDELTQAGVDVLFDDRNARPGFKFKDADLIGIPLRVVIGGKGLKNGEVEIQWRTADGSRQSPRRRGRYNRAQNARRPPPRRSRPRPGVILAAGDVILSLTHERYFTTRETPGEKFMRAMFWLAVWSLVLSFWGSETQTANAAETKHKNVVVIVMDDLGFQAGCYGNKVIKTPAIDRLASEGVRFTRANCTTASCSASRSVLMIGLVQSRHRPLRARPRIQPFQHLRNRPIPAGDFRRRPATAPARLANITSLRSMCITSRNTETKAFRATAIPSAWPRTPRTGSPRRMTGPSFCTGAPATRTAAADPTALQTITMTPTITRRQEDHISAGRSHRAALDERHPHRAEGACGILPSHLAGGSRGGPTVGCLRRHRPRGGYAGDLPQRQRPALARRENEPLSARHEFAFDRAKPVREEKRHHQ